MGSPLLHASHGGCLPSTAPGGDTSPTPTRLAVGGGEPPPNPALQPCEGVKLCRVGEASREALEEGAVGEVVEWRL